MRPKPPQTEKTKQKTRASKKEEQEITIKLHNKRKVERIRRKGSSSK
jgi:hypothetical protein